MKLRWYGWVTVLAVLCLLLDVYAFAGLHGAPGVGKAVAAQARLESPLMHTYIVAGDYALHGTPFMRGFARGLASSSWGDAYASIRQHPELALYMLNNESRGVVHSLMVPAYWAPPVLFLLALIGWFFRSRKVSLIGSGK